MDMDSSIEQLQKEFAMRMIDEEGLNLPHQVERAIIKVKPKAKEVRRFVLKRKSVPKMAAWSSDFEYSEKQKAQDAELAIILDNYNRSMERKKKFQKIFDTEEKSSISQILNVNLEKNEQQDRAKKIKKIEEQKEAWIKAQNFPELTDDDINDIIVNSKQEKLAKKIFLDHIQGKY